MAAALPPGAATGLAGAPGAGAEKKSKASTWDSVVSTTTKGFNTYVVPAATWAAGKGTEMVWFGATVAIVFGLPVLLEIQREAMFQMEKDALQEQQEAMQKSVQEQLAKGMMGGLLGGGSSEEPKADK